MIDRRFIRAELDQILHKHKLWLINIPEGECADLRGANLHDADLYRADLQKAYLQHSDLQNTDLRCANLRGTILRGADLYVANLFCADLFGADLYRAHLRGACLQDADLRNVNLQGADLRCANLRFADLRGADLRGADLRNAYLQGTKFQDADLRDTNLYGTRLYGADLQGANLYGAKNIDCPFACPEKGAFTAFKKANDLIVELLIPENAKRCSATSRKCRCSEAKVISITNPDGTEAGIDAVASSRDRTFIYKVGETVAVTDFDEDRWNECSTGIHFFITRQEAVNYYA